jgi:hypothetical protein
VRTRHHGKRLLLRACLAAVSTMLLCQMCWLVNPVLASVGVGTAAGCQSRRGLLRHRVHPGRDTGLTSWAAVPAAGVWGGAQWLAFWGGPPARVGGALDLWLIWCTLGID